MKFKQLLKSPFAIIGFLFLAFYTISLILLIGWMLLTSVKSNFDFVLNTFGWPSEFHFENYFKAFKQLYVPILAEHGTKKIYFGQLLMNSVVYATISAVLATLSPLCVAYAVARFPYKFGKILFTTALIVMFVPIIGALPSKLRMVRALGLYDNLFVLFALEGHFTGIYFFIFHACFRTLAKDYGDAAKIDGASNFQVFYKINIPLAKNTMFAVFLLCFISNWNEYTPPMLFLPSFPTVSYGLYRFQFSPDQNMTIPLLLCGCTMVCIPTLLLYVLFKNQLVGNLAVGGLKG